MLGFWVSAIGVGQMKSLSVGLILLHGIAVAGQATDVDCDKCVNASDIAGNAVTTSKLRKDSVSSSKIRNGAVSKKKLSSGLSDAVEAAANPLVMDGADNDIGQLVSIGENRWNIEVITDKGFLISVSPRDGKIGNGTVYFSNSTCGDVAYIDGSFFVGYVARVFDDNGVESLVYIAKDSLPIVDFAYQSLLFDDQGCVEQQGQAFVFPFLPNDSTTTGVSATSYPMPVHIEFR